MLELEKFIEGSRKSTTKVSSKKEKEILVLKGRIAELEHHLVTVNGLWAIDRDPKEVTKKFIVENTYQIDIDYE